MLLGRGEDLLPTARVQPPVTNGTEDDHRKTDHDDGDQPELPSLHDGQPATAPDYAGRTRQA